MAHSQWKTFCYRVMQFPLTSGMHLDSTLVSWRILQEVLVLQATSSLLEVRNMLVILVLCIEYDLYAFGIPLFITRVCENFRWIKFCQAQLPLYCRKIWQKNFRQCGKGCHILYAIFNTEQNFSPRWQNFLRIL